MRKPTAVASRIPELTLEWIPRAMRTRMDQARIRISLAQWQLLPMPERAWLARMAADPHGSDAAFVQAVQSALGAAGAGPVRAQPAR